MFNGLISGLASRAFKTKPPTKPIRNTSLVSGTTFVLKYETGKRQSITLSNNATISAIKGGMEGDKLELWVKGQLSNTYVLKCALLPGTDSFIDMVSAGKSITANKTWILQFTYIDSGWRLTSMIGGF